MAATYTASNGVVFNVTSPGKTTGGVLSYSPYLDDNGLPINNRYTGPIQQPVKFINACDIILDASYGGENITSIADLIKTVIDIKLSLQP